MVAALPLVVRVVAVLTSISSVLSMAVDHISMLHLVMVSYGVLISTLSI